MGWTDPLGTYTSPIDKRWEELSLREKIMYDLERSAPAASLAATLVSGARVVSMITEKPIYRILIKGDNSIETDCYDMIDLFKPELDKAYSSIDNLPQWVKERLAVLSILNPNVRNEEVEGVGRRIAKNIYWVYKGEV
jgi:hypothetical protein